jgi:hypothetical protein
MQSNNEKKVPEPELSAVWQELLGKRKASDVAKPSTVDETAIPTLKSDPWRALLQAKGIEVVDLQQLHLHMSDQDLEQILRLIEEHKPAQGT